jgi:hypothetical protein
MGGLPPQQQRTMRRVAAARAWGSACSLTGLHGRAAVLGSLGMAGRPTRQLARCMRRTTGTLRLSPVHCGSEGCAAGEHRHIVHCCCPTPRHHATGQREHQPAAAAAAARHVHGAGDHGEVRPGGGAVPGACVRSAGLCVWVSLVLWCGVVSCAVVVWCPRARERRRCTPRMHTHTHTHTRTHARTHTTLRAARAYAGADIKGRRRQRRAREPHGAGQAAAGAVRVCVPAHLHLVRHRVVCCLLRGRERRWAGVCVRGACAWGVGGGGGSVCAWGVCIGCVWCVWEGGSGGLLQLPGCSWSRVWHTQRGGTHGTSLPPDPQPHAHTRTRARAHANHRPPPPAPRQAWTWRACSRASASL